MLKSFSMDSSTTMIIAEFHLLLHLLLCFCISIGYSQFVSVTINGSIPSSVVDHNFICATLDWWPPDKCDYGVCSWQYSSILNLNLYNPLLHNAVTAFSPLRIRLGGTLQDRIVYDVGDIKEPCLPLVGNSSSMFGYSGGCLPMWRWDQLNAFFQSTGAEVAFGLNVVYGSYSNAQYIGPWDSSNARNFIQITHDKGYNISFWELGNELTGGFTAQVYAAYMIELSTIITEIYGNQSSLPLLAAPDTNYYDPTWIQNFFQVSGQNVVDAFTLHIYNLGAAVDDDLVQKILDPSFLDQEASVFQGLRDTIQQYGPWASSWVGEAGGAYNSGRHLVTDAFVSGFWYLDQLGMAASFGTKCYCRQSLIGGNYGLLNYTTFNPNPDYYGALLWHRLMGTRVLATTSVGSAYLRAYAHCSKSTVGATLLLLNLSNETQFIVNVTIQPSSQMTTREEYHLTPMNGDLHSQTSLLNGVPLEVNAGFHIPDLLPQVVSSSEPIYMMPLSIAFIALPTQIPACS